MGKISNTPLKPVLFAPLDEPFDIDETAAEPAVPEPANESETVAVSQ